MPRFGPPDALDWIGSHAWRAGSVELKALLECGAGPAAEVLTGRADPTWSAREMYLLDTPVLEFLAVGVEIRLRRRARRRFDLAVSVRRVGADVARAVPRGVRVELDVVPGGLWQDFEIRDDVDPAAAAGVIRGEALPLTLLTPTQRAWACRGGDAALAELRLRDLGVFGPLEVNRVKVSAAEGLRRADLEHLRFPSGRELVELSTRCRPREVPTTAAAFERLLDTHDVTVAAGYRTKTSVWHEEIRMRRDDGAPADPVDR